MSWRWFKPQTVLISCLLFLKVAQLRLKKKGEIEPGSSNYSDQSAMTLLALDDVEPLIGTSQFIFSRIVVVAKFCPPPEFPFMVSQAWTLSKEDSLVWESYKAVNNYLQSTYKSIIRSLLKEENLVEANLLKEKKVWSFFWQPTNVQPLKPKFYKSALLSNYHVKELSL